MKIKLYHKYVYFFLFVGFINLNTCYSSSDDDETDSLIHPTKTYIRKLNHIENIQNFFSDVSFSTSTYLNRFIARENQSDKFNEQAKELSEYDTQQDSILYKIPTEILCQMTAYLDYRAKFHQVSRYFFNITADYPLTHISHKGFTYHLKLPQPSLSQIQGIKIDCHKKRGYRIKKIPNYLWYSFVNTVVHIPPNYWSSLKNTRIHNVDLNDDKIGDVGVRDFGWALQGTQVHTVHLNRNQIGDVGVRDFGWALQGTQVQIVYLYGNEISDNGVRDFGRALQGTQVHTVDLRNNKIGDVGVRDFGRALQGTQVHTVDLSNNQISNVGVRNFGQTLQNTQVQTINLSYNQISDIGARDFAQTLQNTQVQTIYLNSNQIGDIGAHDLAQALQGTQVRTVYLSSNQIGNVGAYDLAQALQGTQVRTVYLKFNTIDQNIQNEFMLNYSNIRFYF